MKKNTFFGMVLSVLFVLPSAVSAETMSFEPRNSAVVYNNWGFGGWFYGVMGINYNGTPTIGILTSEMHTSELPKGTYNVTPVTYTDMASGYTLNNGVYNVRELFAWASVYLKDSVPHYDPNNYYPFGAAAHQEMVMSVLNSPFDLHQGNLWYTTTYGYLNEFNAVQQMDATQIDFSSYMVLVPGSQLGLTYADILVLLPSSSQASSQPTASVQTSTATTTTLSPTQKKKRTKKKNRKEEDDD